MILEINHMRSLSSYKLHDKFVIANLKMLAFHPLFYLWKIARELCQNYDIIILGKLSTTSIVSKENRIPKIVKRILTSLSHTKFRKILEWQGKKYRSEIHIVSEWKTTKTCHRCKTEKEVGTDEVYNCENCGLEIGRDINASINFYVK